VQSVAFTNHCLRPMRSLTIRCFRGGTDVTRAARIGASALSQNPQEVSEVIDVLLCTLGCHRVDRNSRHGSSSENALGSQERAGEKSGPEEERTFFGSSCRKLFRFLSRLRPYAVDHPLSHDGRQSCTTGATMRWHSTRSSGWCSENYQSRLDRHAGHRACDPRILLSLRFRCYPR
jgi:hypothetical protein